MITITIMIMNWFDPYGSVKNGNAVIPTWATRISLARPRD
jgi:hypothetical protein